MSTSLVNGEFNIHVHALAPEDKKGKFSDESNLGFGQLFTDRMFYQEYTEGKWQEAQIKKLEPMEMLPSASVFHYAQEFFEGMKAYYHPNGDIALFRPEKNAKRFNRSATRLAMPKVDPKLFVWALEELVKLEKDWIPKKTKGASLYIRPTMIATESFLGVRPSASYTFFVILSPSGPFFKEGFSPVNIFVSTKYTRAAPGGTGNVKAGGNYAASIVASQEAITHSCQQVLWLDAVHRKYVEEVGAMNIFFVKNDELVTPPLTGTILPGNTRESVLTLATDLGYTAKEEKLSIDEIAESIQKGQITEVFGCGTAAIIAPVGNLVYNDQKFTISEGQVGSITRHLYDELTGIQYGEKEDRFNWMHIIP